MTSPTEGTLDFMPSDLSTPTPAGLSGIAFQLEHLRKVEAFGKLAGGVAHDFNNLLTIISGYTEMLLFEFDTATPQRELLMEVQRAATRAATLTSQLLAFSRFQRFSPSIISLGSVVIELRKMLQRLAGDDIELIIKASEDAGPVFADPRQIEVVLINLAINARDAMPLGGQLTLEVSVVCDPLSTLPPGPYVQLAVSDTGKGIPEALRERIFEPFFSTKARAEAAGMGLSACQRIISKSCGHIMAESTPGKGSTFRVFLPYHDKSPEGAKKSSQKLNTASPHGNREAILLIEEDQVVQKLYGMLLSSLDYTALIAADVEEVSRIASCHPEIRLVIADPAMPLENGASLPGTINAILPGTRLLFISGYAFEPLESLDEITRTPFLPKPLSRDSLAHKIRELLATA